VSLFRDDFESYSSTTTLLSYQSLLPGRWLAKGKVDLTTASAASGSKAVRFTYPTRPGGYQDQSVFIEAALVENRADPNVVVISWLMRTMPGYAWTYEGNTAKIMIMNIGGGDSRFAVLYGREPLTPTALQSAYGKLGELRPNISIGANNYNQNLNYPAMRLDGVVNDGGWHRHTVRLTKSASRPDPTSGNGRVEYWIDGVKVIEYVGDDSSRPEYGLVNVPTTRMVPDMHFPSTYNGGVASTQWMEFDNMRIWAE
jgi:hypothetical protein